ncbi:hypothetical protein [Couchioplanes caeruleus]|uniref:Uncharacterized protein n=2 Tax=Couchioplanes caeruleus TaxID=56438 RepID=A0A1K0FDM4_9ACTN|nr:hypothetical protein [Couchioplanes caeruleus]OJF10848.1 hypothetical protein BG844_29670 [Couchioplanes caeruleus subsp. caeruleus]ROP32815.1 hypothetical protein EDD30_5763 [Couchioplanes caeruleus]
MTAPLPSDGHRFRDPRTHLATLASGDVIVICPRCAGPAIVRPHSDGSRYSMFWPRRLTCTGCAYYDSWTSSSPWYWEGPIDPFFQQPLWLRANCCGGKTLWAYHGEHLDLIEDYVRARQRERGPERSFTSLLEKLPAWIKAAGNRDEILRTCRQLRAKLPE